MAGNKAQSALLKCAQDLEMMIVLSNINGFLRVNFMYSVCLCVKCWADFHSNDLTDFIILFVKWTFPILGGKRIRENFAKLGNGIKPPL